MYYHLKNFKKNYKKKDSRVHVRVWSFGVQSAVLFSLPLFSQGELQGSKAAMAKGGGLWDDSALINAFDDAMSKYKVYSSGFALSICALAILKSARSIRVCRTVLFSFFFSCFFRCFC